MASRWARWELGSPLVRGSAVKGPTAKLMAELGIEPSNASIARHYAGLVDGLLIHEGDDIPENVAFAATDTLMHTPIDRERVARAVLDLAARLAR